MAWNHPDDVPTSLTRRAYEMDACLISQNDYAAVVADAYEFVKAEVLRDLGKTTTEPQQEEHLLTRDNTDEIAEWVGGWRAGGVRELIGWGLRDHVTYARPGDLIARRDNGTFYIKHRGPQQ